MGGEETEIGEQTTDVLLEAANFEPTGLYRTSERLRLRTEGSNRWEKGVDPYLAEQAAKLATELIVETAGAEWVGHVDVQGDLPERPVISYRPERADELIGLATPADDQKRWLERLEFETRDGEVVAPTFRARDVTREVDVVEEVARERLEEVPFTLPTRSEMFGALTPVQRLRRRVEDVLTGLGLAETYTPSLRAEDSEPNALRLPEPISVELSVLRTGPPPEPRRRGTSQPRARRRKDCALRSRPRLPPSRMSSPTSASRVAAILEGDFSRAKGIVETLYAAIKAEPEFERADDPLLHPGKAARTRAGVLGELMPGVLEGAWGAFELELGTLLEESRDPSYEDVITYPPVRQDLAFAVADDVPAGELVAAAREAAGPELREMRAFDVYRGDQVGEGRKSIAFAVVFQSPERTLSDEDAAKLRERIVGALAERYEAELRA